MNISGVYQLEDVENYMEYLLAMDIPERVVRHLARMRCVEVFYSHLVKCIHFQT